MADVRPLIFSTVTGTPEVLNASDTLVLQGAVRFDGLVGFNRTAPSAPGRVDAGFVSSIDQLISALAATGLIVDSRPGNWLPGGLASLLNIGPYEPGRLIIGGVTGWQQLDMPAVVGGVIQVPTAHAGALETNPVTRLGVQTLAYSPILSYGPTAPVATNAQAGALWYDSTAQALMVFSGSAWEPVLSAALSGLNGLSGRGVLGFNGSALTLLSSPSAGASLVATGSDNAWVEWITTGVAPAWPNGGSATDPKPGGGGRPAGITSAIWCNAAPQAETMGFWDEAERRWKSVYVDNPLLNQLAELRGTAVDGDLFSIGSGRMVRLPLGGAGDQLSSNGSALQWRKPFTESAAAPSAPLAGDLWRNTATGRFSVYTGSSWQSLLDQSSYGDVNGSSSALRPGVPLVHDGNNWQLADGRSQAAFSAQVVGVAQSAANPGLAVTVALDGLAVATEAEWFAAIDSADGNSSGTGLRPGSTYYLSGRSAGMLSRSPGPTAVVVGTALDATHLLLQSGRISQAPYGRVHQGTTAPATGKVDELWFDSATSQLKVAIASGSGVRWVSANGTLTSLPTSGTGGGAATTAAGLADVEAIDWIMDPKAAALRFLKGDGSTETIRVKGTGGAVVTMSDDHTLCIDAPMPPGGGLVKIDGGRFSP